jgi:hypothetical protein
MDARHLLPTIDRHGWVVQARIGAPVAYTVGLTALGLPELVAYGWVSPKLSVLLHAAAAHLVAYGVKTKMKLVDGTKLRLRPVDPSQLPTAAALYGPRLRALEVRWR